MTVKSSLSPIEVSPSINNEDASGGSNLIRKRPKSVSQWTVADVQKWLRKNCGDVYHLYSIKFLEQDITGKINKSRTAVVVEKTEKLGFLNRLEVTFFLTGP